MSSSPSYRARKNGIYYTPPPLAELLVKRLIRAPGSVLDPACGNGALLLAAARRHSQLGRGQAGGIWGCDKFKPKTLSVEGQKIKFTKQDFFDYVPQREFDVILMNPPYLSAERMGKTRRERLHKRYGRNWGLSLHVDIWAYFLAKSIAHLPKGGSVGAILPWSFLQADFAARVREWLAAHFRTIETLVVNGVHFQHTTKRVLLLWLSGYEERGSSIRLGFTDTLDTRLKFRNVPQEKWCEQSVPLSASGDVDDILSEYGNAHSFLQLGEVARVSIGVVTGADRFFVMPAQVAKASGFHHTNLVPILTSGRELQNLILRGKVTAKCLLTLSAKPPESYFRYLRKGKRNGLH
ncbi:hypothetical protein LCGC14_2849990, partial [marine sediment metagenome]